MVTYTLVPVRRKTGKVVIGVKKDGRLIRSGFKSATRANRFIRRHARRLGLVKAPRKRRKVRRHHRKRRHKRHRKRRY